MKEFDARPGTVWRCQRCGRRAANRITGGVDDGWGADCIRHSILCDDKDEERDTNGRLIAVRAAEYMKTGRHT